jgi:hypothetical protein
MARGDLQWSGRAVRWLLWRAPKGAAKYTWDSNMALASDLGRRWIVLLVYGGFLWWVATPVAEVVTPLRTPVVLLKLLWLWWAVSLAQWSWRARPGTARNRQAMREMYQVVHEIRGDVQQGLRQMAASVPRPDGGVDVLGMFKSAPDPIAAEQARTRADQARQVRDMLPDDQRDLPLGDRAEPLVKMPRWLRRRGPR